MVSRREAFYTLLNFVHCFLSVLINHLQQNNMLAQQEKYVMFFQSYFTEIDIYITNVIM